MGPCNGGTSGVSKPHARSCSACPGSDGATPRTLDVESPPRPQTLVHQKHRLGVREKAGRRGTHQRPVLMCLKQRSKGPPASPTTCLRTGRAVDEPSLRCSGAVAEPRSGRVCGCFMSNEPLMAPGEPSGLESRLMHMLYVLTNPRSSNPRIRMPGARAMMWAGPVRHASSE